VKGTAQSSTQGADIGMNARLFRAVPRNSTSQTFQFSSPGTDKTKGVFIFWFKSFFQMIFKLF